jgi:hypothetical protein
MFTVKIYYRSGQVQLYSAERVIIGSPAGSKEHPGPSMNLFGPGTFAERFEFDGTETVYVENMAGKTVEVIRPKPEPCSRPK